MKVHTLANAEFLATDGLRVAVAELKELRSQLDALSKVVAEDLVNIPDEVWSAAGKGAFSRVGQQLSLAINEASSGLADALSAVLIFQTKAGDGIKDARRSIKRLAQAHDMSLYDKVRATVTFLSDEPSDKALILEAQDALARARLSTQNACTVLEGSLRHLRRATGLFIAQPANLLGLDLRHDPYLENIGKAWGQLDAAKGMLAGTPSATAYAAALFLDEGDAVRKLIAERVSAGLISERTLAQIRALGLDRLEKASLLNARIQDWPTGSDVGDRRRHGVFVDQPVFAGRPKITDIAQGDVGDCWILAALGAIAMVSPDRIEKMITDNYDGTYSVRFADGQVVTVSGDMWAQDWSYVSEDYTKDTSNLRMAHANEHGTAQWPWIIEKAYATRAGGFDAPGEVGIDGGYATDAFKALVGWESSVRGGIRGDVVDVTGISVVGIRSDDFSHAYTVVGYKYGEDGNRLIGLFNPWGLDELPAGTDLKVIKDAKNDGVFYVKENDFRNLDLNSFTAASVFNGAEWGE